MAAPVPWPAVGAIAAGVVSLYFIRYLWPHRDDLGARFFIGTIGCEALWAFSYGVALLVFDPALRALLEIPIWIGIDFIGVFFLAFALEYTGRGHLVRSKLMGSVVTVQLFHTAVVVTNPLHHVAWSGYRIDPTFGAATVSYSHQPWLFVNFVGIYLMVAAGSFLLVDTFFSYGPLYRAQTAAIALSPVLPGLAFTVWLFEIGWWFPLNLTPLTFPLHLGFDTYAFFRRDMFELTPAARRAGERAVIDDLGSPVVVLDTERRIINANEAARRSFVADERELLARDVTTLIDGLDGPIEEGTVVVTTGGERREYRVNPSVLRDPAGSEIGSTLVFQDVTEEKRREQRLTVLNRVLRHNLRNDLNVVLGRIGIAVEEVSDDDLRDTLRTAESRAEKVMELGENARAIERLLDTERPGSGSVGIRDVLEEIRDRLLADYPAARFEFRVPERVRVRSDPRVARAVFENLLENAVEHDDSGAPTVEVVLVEVDAAGLATFEVRDDGPGIPDHEVRAVETGVETPLEHGSGLGLWTVRWGVDSLGGEIRFDADEGGTTVRLKLPTAGRPGNTSPDETDVAGDE